MICIYFLYYRLYYRIFFSINQKFKEWSNFSLCIPFFGTLFQRLYFWAMKDVIWNGVLACNHSSLLHTLQSWLVSDITNLISSLKTSQHCETLSNCQSRRTTVHSVDKNLVSIEKFTGPLFIEALDFVQQLLNCFGLLSILKSSKANTTHNAIFL